MYCISCGEENRKRAQICRRCGRPLKHALDSQDDVPPQNMRELPDRLFRVTILYSTFEFIVSIINTELLRARNAGESATRDVKKWVRVTLGLGIAVVFVYFLVKWWAF